MRIDIAGTMLAFVATLPLVLASQGPKAQASRRPLPLGGWSGCACAQAPTSRPHSDLTAQWRQISPRPCQGHYRWGGAIHLSTRIARNAGLGSSISRC